MKKREYEKLMEVLKALSNVADWRGYLYGRTVTVNDEEKQLTDVIDRIRQAASYEELSREYKVYDSWVEDVNKSVNDMQEIVKFHEAAKKSGNKEIELPEISAEKTPASADIKFFEQMAKEVTDAKSKTLKDSGEFKKMEKALNAVNKLLNSQENLSEGERDKKLYAAFDALEQAADKYLEHKVKHGTDKKSLVKIDIATNLKDYIRDRKTEIFRRQITDEVNQQEAKRRNKYYTNYDRKAIEVKNTKDHILDMCIKMGVSYDKTEEIREVFEKADNLTYYGNQKYDSDTVKDHFKELEQDHKECAASILVADFLRNELLTGGGEATPMIKKFIKEPKAFMRTLKETEAVAQLYSAGYNKENLDKFAAQSPKANVLEAYGRSRYILSNKMVFDATISNQAYMIREEKKEAEKQQIEKEKRTKIELAELQKQEKAKEISDKYKENLRIARTYAGLAKFARENLKGEKNEKLASEWAKKAKEYSVKAMFGEEKAKQKEEKKTPPCKEKSLRNKELVKSL